MGFIDKIKKSLYEEVPGQEPDPVKQEMVQKPLITNSTIKTPNMELHSPNPFMVQPVQPIISAEDKEKWQKYFTNVFAKAKADNPEYGQLLANIETVLDTDATLPEANRFKMAFSFMKKAGITKDKLLASLAAAAETVNNDRKVIFEPDIAKREQAIQNAINLIAEKRKKITELTNEIQQLELENNNGREKIANKTVCYNTLSQQLLSKIQNDIVNINNYIQ